MKINFWKNLYEVWDYWWLSKTIYQLMVNSRKHNFYLPSYVCGELFLFGEHDTQIISTVKEVHFGLKLHLKEKNIKTNNVQRTLF